jgi:hypothetical protein
MIYSDRTLATAGPDLAWRVRSLVQRKARPRVTTGPWGRCVTGLYRNTVPGSGRTDMAGRAALVRIGLWPSPVMVEQTRPFLKIPLYIVSGLDRTLLEGESGRSIADP